MSARLFLPFLCLIAPYSYAFPQPGKSQQQVIEKINKVELLNLAESARAASEIIGVLFGTSSATCLPGAYYITNNVNAIILANGIALSGRQPQLVAGWQRHDGGLPLLKQFPT